MQRRALLGAGLAAWLGAAGCAGKRALSLIVPFPPGGGGDVLARSAAAALEALGGERLLVVNRPGAAGTLGAKVAARAPADGRTIVYVTNGIWCVNRFLTEDAWNPLEVLTPVSLLSRMGLVLVLNPHVLEGVTDYASLVAYLKRHPGVVPYATAGAGTTSHMAGVRFAEQAGVRINAIAHTGGAAALTEVLAGRIPFLIDVMPNVLPQVSGNGAPLRPLAVTTIVRSVHLPDVPTLSERGLTGFDLFAWDSLALPPGVSSDVTERWKRSVDAVLNSDAFKSHSARLGAEPFAVRTDMKRFLAVETPKWAELARKAVPSDY